MQLQSAVYYQLQFVWLTCCVSSPKAVSTDKGPCCSWGQSPALLGNPSAASHVASIWSRVHFHCCYLAPLHSPTNGPTASAGIGTRTVSMSLWQFAVWVMTLYTDSRYRLSEENITFVFRAESIQVDTTEVTAVFCSEWFKFPFKDMKYYTVCECEQLCLSL